MNGVQGCLGLLLPRADWKQVFKHKSFIWNMILDDTKRGGDGYHQAHDLCGQLEPGLALEGRVEHASELPQLGFYPPGPQSRYCQHTDGVPL